jgi:predicted CoA-binding protein
MTEIFSPKQPVSEEAPVAEVLQRANTVAVVGISEKPDRDSHKVAKYLKDHGYKIIPVNPKLKEVLGEPCYPDLKSIPEHIDLVDIFRSTDAIPGIVDEAIAAGAGSVWMQLGLIHQEAAEKARKAGLSVVMNRCTKIEHTRLSGGT